MKPQRNMRFVFNLSIWVLLLIVIIVAVSPARDALINHFFGSAPPPAATVTPGDNLFFIQALPQGTIYIDGHLLAHPPAVGGKPLRLSPGRHQILWKADPFEPLSCVVSIPSSVSSGQCNDESPTAYENGNARLITFAPTLVDLFPPQKTALIQHIQEVLTTMTSTTTVEPGEHYIATSVAGVPAVLTATRLLKATLSFHLDTNLASSNSCATGFGDDCSLNGQNCLQLCNTPDTNQVNGITTTGNNINLLALFYPLWTYTTLDGQIVAQNQPDALPVQANTDHSLFVHVLWDSKEWDVNLITENNVFFGTAGNAHPACASVNNIIQSGNYQTVPEAGNVSWKLFAGTDPAAGCLGVVIPDDSQQSVAYCLYRFGVLLAANDAAHRYFPDLPLADAYEQGIAAAIARQFAQ